MRNGVAEERAFDMGHLERLAYCVVFGRFEGGEWDWNAMEWRKRS